MSKYDERILEILKQAENLKYEEFSPKLKEALCYAGTSRKKDLCNKACEITYRLLDGLERRIIRKYGIFPGNSSYDDYKAECALTILEHMSGWDMKKGDLTTYFAPLFEKTCMRERMRETGMPSLYYETIRQHIQKARENLAKEGCMSPTIQELQAAIKKYLGYEYTLNILMRVWFMSFESVSLEKEVCNGKTLEDFTTESNHVDDIPEENEKQEIIDTLCNSLSEEHRLFIQAMYTVCKQQSREGTATTRVIRKKDVFEIMRQTYPDASELWLDHGYEEAVAEFRHLGRSWGRQNGYLSRHAANVRTRNHIQEVN